MSSNSDLPVFTGEYPTEDWIAQCTSVSDYHDFDCSGPRPSMICRVCGYKDRSVRRVMGGAEGTSSDLNDSFK